MKTEHPNISVKESGLIVNKDYPHLKTSPDGIVECMCCHCGKNKGLLEIKCPYKYRNETPLKAAENSDFCCVLANGKLKLKTSHNYFYQVQGQMAIAGMSWCDFYVWTLKGTSIERIYFDKDFWESVVEKLNVFYFDNIIPELFSR